MITNKLKLSVSLLATGAVLLSAAHTLYNNIERRNVKVGAEKCWLCQDWLTSPPAPILAPACFLTAGATGFNQKQGCSAAGYESKRPVEAAPPNGKKYPKLRLRRQKCLNLSYDPITGTYKISDCGSIQECTISTEACNTSGT
jgi:hypothetical protein